MNGGCHVGYMLQVAELLSKNTMNIEVLESEKFSAHPKVSTKAFGLFVRRRTRRTAPTMIDDHDRGSCSLRAFGSVIPRAFICCVSGAIAGFCLSKRVQAVLCTPQWSASRAEAEPAHNLALSRSSLCVGLGSSGKRAYLQARQLEPPTATQRVSDGPPTTATSGLGMYACELSRGGGHPIGHTSRALDAKRRG